MGADPFLGSAPIHFGQSARRGDWRRDRGNRRAIENSQEAGTKMLREAARHFLNGKICIDFLHMTIFCSPGNCHVALPGEPQAWLVIPLATRPAWSLHLRPGHATAQVDSQFRKEGLFGNGGDSSVEAVAA